MKTLHGRVLDYDQKEVTVKHNGANVQQLVCNLIISNEDLETVQLTAWGQRNVEKLSRSLVEGELYKFINLPVKAEGEVAGKVVNGGTVPYKLSFNLGSFKFLINQPVPRSFAISEPARSLLMLTAPPAAPELSAGPSASSIMPLSSTSLLCTPMKANAQNVPGPSGLSTGASNVPRIEELIDTELSAGMNNKQKDLKRKANVNRSIVNEDMNAALEPKAKKSKANRSSGLTASIGECSSNIDARNKSEAGEDCEITVLNSGLAVASSGSKGIKRKHRYVVHSSDSSDSEAEDPTGRPVRAAAVVSRERIRQQVAIWNQMREQREQDLLERREWALWSQLPPSHNVEERPPPPPTLTELQVYSLADIYTSKEAYECPICLMSINTDDIIIPLRCGTTGPKHIFCLGCAREWLTERTGACPGCNTPVRLIK